MKINSITSFKGETLETMIGQEPAYSQMASTSIQPDSFEKTGSSTGKKIATTIGLLALIATGLGLLRGKTEAFGKTAFDFKDNACKFSEQENLLDKTKWVIAKAGDTINEYASKTWNGIKKLFGKGEDAVDDASNKGATDVKPKTEVETTKTPDAEKPKTADAEAKKTEAETTKTPDTEKTKAETETQKAPDAETQKAPDAETQKTDAEKPKTTDAKKTKTDDVNEKPDSTTNANEAQEADTNTILSDNFKLDIGNQNSKKPITVVAPNDSPNTLTLSFNFNKKGGRPIQESTKTGTIKEDFATYTQN